MMRLPPLTKVLTALALYCAISSSAQKIGSNAQPGQNGTYTLNVSTQLVVETVVVRDKHGRFVPGLSAKDFRVTEDGAPQKVKIFRRQDLASAKALSPLTAADEEHITLYRRLEPMRIAPEIADHSQYSGHWLMVLYFDMTAMPPDDQQRALEAARSFVRTKMTTADLVAIMRYTGGAVQVVQDFTADRDRLLSILETMTVGEGQGSADSLDGASSADTQVAFGQDDSEFNIFNNDRQLSALQTAAELLSHLSEKKELVYFASGMRLSGLDNLAQLHATIDAAIRAGVTFWPVDARGLVAAAPLGDASHGSPGNIGMYTGAAAHAVRNDFQQSQDTLYSLGADTGGKALFDNNDLTQGILRAQHSVEDYYILGYYTSNTVENGRFRRIKITVDSPLADKLDYRHGYFARKTFKHFNQADKERQLEDAMMLGDPITDLTIAMEIDYFQLDRAEYFVPVTVKIPGRELALAKKFGAQHTVIDFLCEVRDSTSGATMTNLRDHVDIRLSDQTAAQLLHSPVEYDTGFTLLPGTYSIKFLARDDETGRIGTYETSFVIPDLNRVKRGVAISSVILGNQRIQLNSALYNVARRKQQDKNNAANPLVQQGYKLIPSVNRVFSRDRQLYVYAQAYQNDPAPPPGRAPQRKAPPASPQTYFAYVSFYRGRKLALQTPPIATTAKADTRLGVVPLHIQIGIGSLAAGKYICQLSVLDPNGERAVFWRGRVLIVP